MSTRGSGASRAFPNAYLETDEPPRRFPWDRVLSASGALGVAYFGVTILALSLFDADYSPVSQAASDYGVGRFALEMNVGFSIGGVGMMAFAWVLGRKQSRTRSRAGSALLFMAGLVLTIDSYFTTNVEGGPATFHGLIHGFGGFVFFVAAPIGVILVTRKSGRVRLLAVVVGLVAGFSMLAANAGLSGLAERVIMLVIFSSVIVESLGLAGLSKPSHAN